MTITVPPARVRAATASLQPIAIGAARMASHTDGEGLTDREGRTTVRRAVPADELTQGVRIPAPGACRGALAGNRTSRRWRRRPPAYSRPAVLIEPGAA
jgi:hypothetical protein